MIKAVLISIVLIFLYLVLAQVKKDYAAIVLLSGCVLLFFFSTEKLMQILEQVRRLSSYLSIRKEHFLLLLKIAGVAYLAELSSSLCKDAGLGAAASQVEMIGKLTILGFSIPVVLSLFETISRFF